MFFERRDSEKDGSCLGQFYTRFPLFRVSKGILNYENYIIYNIYKYHLRSSDILATVGLSIPIHMKTHEIKCCHDASADCYFFWNLSPRELGFFHFQLTVGTLLQSMVLGTWVEVVPGTHTF